MAACGRQSACPWAEETKPPWQAAGVIQDTSGWSSTTDWLRGYVRFRLALISILCGLMEMQAGIDSVFGAQKRPGVSGLRLAGGFGQ